MNNINEVFNKKTLQMGAMNTRTTYATIIGGCNADNEFLLSVLGEKEAKQLSELGFTKFCDKKTEEFFKTYPFAEETTTMKQPATNPSSGSGAKNVSKKKSGTKCPLCDNMMIELEGDSYNQWNKQMKHWRGLVCPDSKKDGTGKCKQGFIKLPSKNEIDQANHQDDIDDQAHHLPIINYDEYGNEI